MDEPTDSQHRQTRPDPAEAPARLSSEVLFGAQREVVIVHNGREYRLRLTQNDKMILTA
jgi:hemin uptake protein HemP